MKNRLGLIVGEIEAGNKEESLHHACKTTSQHKNLNQAAVFFGQDLAGPAGHNLVCGSQTNLSASIVLLLYWAYGATGEESATQGTGSHNG
jgi:hypothetical protein